MHPSLITFSSEKFYDGKVQSDNDMKQIQAPLARPWSRKHHAVFVDMKHGRERRKGSSYDNQEEAEAIVKYVQELLDSKERTAGEIGVITGYAAQVSCIERRLSALQVTKGVSVRTVDGFQGQERQVIFFSAVRTEQNVGFLKDHNRMNVMFTRAKQGLAVVGRRGTLVRDPLWKEWLERHTSFPP